ncbi:MAG: chitobiase/beta-hexosaminidase C-terminal domain-containing protein [Paludibacteraceae bacterium]|nr:chitobiase/beta-hexosaminidase C-terminal domain-containing protein [Paludibacteraceae bacterium]
MRKITLFFAALLISMTAFAADITGGTKLYLKPGSAWTQGNERFAAYFFNSSTNAWVGMTVEEDGSSYLAETPEGTWTNVIFCRMNGSNATNDWGAKWDQTENLTYDGTNNCYSIASSSNGTGTGSWGVYAPTPTTWTVVGGSIELFGASWDTGKVENDLTEGENSVWTKFYDDVQLSAGDIEYKIAKNHAWTESYPGSNAKLNIPAAGKYDVTFTFNASTKAVNAVAEEVVEAPAITATWSIEEGAELESFTEATITFTGVDAATTTSMYPACFYTVAEDGTTTLVENYCTAGVLDRTATGTSIKLWVDEETGCYEGKITAGNYRIVLSAGMVKFNNDNSNKNTEEYVLNFTINNGEVALPEVDAVYTVNPENNATVTEIREIVLNFTDYETISVAELDLNMGTNVPQFTKYDADFDLYQPCGYIFFKADTASANGLRLYIPSEFMGTDAIAVEGQYQIVIPAGVVTFSDGISKAITLNYTVKAAPATVTKQFTYSHTFASGDLGSDGSPLATTTLSDVAWNFAMTGSTYLGWDSNNGKGLQIGKSKEPATSIVLSTNGIEGKITKVVVNTCGASGVNTTFDVKVNGVAYTPASATLTTTATDYEFTGAETGEIVLTWTNQGKGLYIKSINIEYEKEVAADAVDAPVFSVEGGVKEEAFNLELTCATADAEIYYTLNGGEETKYTAAINIATTTTVKAWAVKGDKKSDEVTATYTFIEYIENATIAQVLAAEPSDYVWYKMTGVIDSLYNTTYGNFYFVDGQDTIIVYGLTATKVAPNNDKSFASLNLVEGDKITIWGTRSAFNGKPQVGGPAYFVEKVEEPVEPTPTIVEGIKLYVQFPTAYSVLQSSVTFGKKATGGKLSPVKRGMSIGGGTIGGGTTTGTAMTKVDAENGVWEVVAPAGTSDSLFSVVFSMKGYTTACNIADLKYDGEHNLFTLSSDFTFDIRRGGTATEANGTWGVYPFPAPAITATWSIEEGAELESFTEATITFTGVDAATTTTMYPACFYKVAEDGTTALVENYCTAGVLDRTATGASIKLWVDEETGCYEGKITAGNYRIVLSAGMVKFNNDNTNKNTEDYVLNFSIKGSDTPALEEIDAVYTVNPENNAIVTEIREIVLNFTGYETIAVAEPDMATGRNIPTVYFEEELTGSMMPAGYIMFKADTASANGLRLYVDPAYTGGAESYAAEGKYAINIPAGVVTFSDGISKAITLNYTVKAGEVGPEITEMEAKNAYAYDVKVETNDDKTAATVSYRLNAPAVAVKVYAKVEGEIVKAVEGTTICRYADGVADNLNTVEVSLEGLEEYAGKAVTFAVEVTGTLVENPTLVPVSYGFYHSQGVDVDVNPESEFFGRAYVTECAPDGIGKDYHSSITGQGLYAFDALLAPIANKDGNYGFKGGLTTDATSKDPRKVRISEDGRVFLTRQAITGVSPLVEVNPADLNANFADVFVDFTHDAETYELKTADGKYMASPNIAFDVKGQGEDLKVFMLSTTKAGIAYNPRGNFAKEYNLGTSTTWSAEPSATIDALDTLTHYTVNYLGVSVEYDNEGGIWYAQYRGTPKESEPTLIHVNAQGVEDYKDFTFVSRSSAIRFNNDFSLLAIAGNGGKKCTIFKVEKDAEGKPVLNKQYEFAVNGNNINDMAWDYANNLYIVNSSSELLYMYAMPRESAVVTTPAAERYSVKMPMPMEVEFENIAAIYEMGMWDMAYYESYSNYEVVALLKSQPTVVDKVVTSGMMGGNMNNYYLNDGTGVIVLQAEGDRYEPITDENWEVIGWDTISGLNIEVGKKLPVDFMANIDFKVVTDEETWLPTGEVYGAPVMTFVPKATGEVIVDEYGWETIVTESNEEFAARCEASDFVEEAVEANLDDVLANRIDYAGKLLVLDTTANYYAESNPYMGTMSAYMFWNAEEAFDVETYEEEGTTVVYVSPKYTEDYNNFAGKLFNVNGEELPEAALATAATINVVNARFDWNSIAQGQTLVVKEGWSVEIPQGPQDNVENGELVVNIYSNNGSVYVETEAGAMIEVYTVNGLRVYAGVSNTNTTIINGLNTNIAIIRVNGETYKVFVK